MTALQPGAAQEPLASSLRPPIADYTSIRPETRSPVGVRSFQDYLLCSRLWLLLRRFESLSCHATD